MEEIFTFPHCFFFSMVAPLDFEELGHLAAHGSILLIHDFDRMLRIRQVCFEWCHFWQYNIHECLQALLQL
jgi:hypothetical protein